MTLPFTTDIPTYVIRGESSLQLDVFNKKQKAIKAAIKMASEYSGITFHVIEKQNWSEEVIFSITLNYTTKFENLPLLYKGIVDVFQAKLNKIKFWRKADGSSD